jgi:hypothetical protein
LNSNLADSKERLNNANNDLDDSSRSLSNVDAALKENERKLSDGNRIRNEDRELYVNKNAEYDELIRALDDAVELLTKL